RPSSSSELLGRLSLAPRAGHPGRHDARGVQEQLRGPGAADALRASGGLTAMRCPPQSTDSDWNAAMSHLIHQEIVIAASPQRVYSALTDSRQFSALSGAPAEISNEAGGVFSCF